MRDIYQNITDQIVQALEQGVRPWHQPWNAGHMEGRVALPLRHNGVAYRGVNVLALWMQAMAKGYAAPVWMTFKQALVLGANVRKGEKGSLVVYADKITRTETDADTAEESVRNIHYMKGYVVFESFRDAGAYYATLGHETCHWTKHPTRLDRDFGRKRWGDEGYAMEELVAELGAAFLSADLELTPELRDDHASYIEHWLKVLKSDNRAIFAAASHAQRAADFLHGASRAAETATEAA